MPPNTDKNQFTEDAMLLRRQLLEEAPALDTTEKLFEKLDNVLFCLKDSRGCYLGANGAFLRHVKLDDLSQLVGRTAAEIFPSVLAAGYEQQDMNLVAEGRETHDRLEMITNPNGSYGWFLSDKVLVRGREDQVLAIASMSRDLHAPTDSDGRLGRLSSVIERMKKDYAEPLRIPELAKDAGFSCSSLERLMGSVYKLTPKQVLIRMRIEAAADRLRETDDAIAVIALDCGFCDQAALCRSFRAITGTTALRYRKLSRLQATGAPSSAD